MAITGLNHLTLAVTDLDRALAFYRDLLGLTLRARWTDGAYLEAGDLWLCLARDADASQAVRSDTTHAAFSVSEPDFAALAEKIASQAPLWKENRSEGASLYFLDPDGHKLEIHVGSLESRIAHYRDHPEKGVTVS